MIRWVGQPAQFVRRLNRRTGQVEVDVDYKFESKREIASARTIRTLRPRAHENDKAGVEGLSRTYHWGPVAPYLAEVLPSDWAIIQATAVGDRFEDVTDHQGRLGSRTIKGYYRDRMIRKLDDPLHAGAVAMANKRLGLPAKLILPPGVELAEDDEG